jgi:hypothetical protein
MHWRNREVTAMKSLLALAMLALAIQAPLAHGAPTDSSSSAPARAITITGTVAAISSAILTVHVPAHGPGLSHGPGIHSMLIIAARDHKIDISQAKYRKADGTAIAAPHIAVGDRVTVAASPRQDGSYKATQVILGAPVAPASPPSH